MRWYTCAALNTWSWTHTEANPNSSARRASWMMDCTSSIPWLFCNEIPMCIVSLSSIALRGSSRPTPRPRSDCPPVPSFCDWSVVAEREGPLGAMVRGQALHDDLVDLASPFHRTPVQALDEMLGCCIRVDEEPALECKELIEALRLKFPDDRVHRTRHIGIDFAMRKARLRQQGLINGFQACNECWRCPTSCPTYFPKHIHPSSPAVVSAHRHYLPCGGRMSVSYSMPVSAERR